MTTSLKKLNYLVSRHTTRWFQTIRSDELSPAHSARIFCDEFLDYLDSCKLSLTCGERELRRNICEFICTYYVSRKRRIGMRGPFSAPPRPVGWTAKHETEWSDYLHYSYFSSDFWDRFWNNIPEALWEYKTPGWRGAISAIVTHYVAVQPHKIDSQLDASMLTTDMNDTGAYVGYVGSAGDDDGY